VTNVSGTNLRSQHCCNHEAGIVQDALDKPLVGRDVAPHPDHPDALHRLRLRKAVAVPFIDLPSGKVGGTGDDRDLLPGLHPLPAVLKRPARRRVDLRGEIIGQKEDVQWITCRYRL